MSSDNIWACCHVRLSKLIAFRCWYMISPHVRDSFLSQLNLANFPGPALATNLPSCEIHLLVYARDDISRKTITTNKAALVSMCTARTSRKNAVRPATWAAKRE
jgi:hypothetical protein